MERDGRRADCGGGRRRWRHTMGSPDTKPDHLRLFTMSYTQSREFDYISVFHKAESSRAPSQLPVQHLYSQVVAQ